MAEKYLPLQEKFWMIEEEFGVDMLQWMGDNYHTFCVKCMQKDEGARDCRINAYKRGKFRECWRGEHVKAE